VIDLTGANLVAYLMRVVKDAVIRNPRFRNTLGEVTFSSNNAVNWGDVQVVIKSVTTSGTRLSPDYFMCTQHGRTILAKVGDKEGSFVEWVTENDKTRKTPKAGTYYFNVDAVDEQTRNVNLTVQQFRWETGQYKDAEGSIIGLAPGIDANDLTVIQDANHPTNQINIKTYPTTTVTAAPVPYFYLLSPCERLVLGTYSTTLVPNVDYWILRRRDVVVLPNAAGGSEIVGLPTADPALTYRDGHGVLQAAYTFITFLDQDGYELRKGVDYTFQGPGFIILSNWTPKGMTLTARATLKLDPFTNDAMNPENIIHLNIGPTETLASGNVFIQTPAGDFNNAVATVLPAVEVTRAVAVDGVYTLASINNLVVGSQVGLTGFIGDYTGLNDVKVVVTDQTPTHFQFVLGTDTIASEDQTAYSGPGAQATSTFEDIILPTLLLPGEYYRFEVRILTANFTVVGKKYELNGFKKTRWDSKAGAVDANAPPPGAFVLDLDDNGQPIDPIPGMVLAIGDAVVKDDQCAILVNPDVTETYEVFGSKENLSFTLDCKSNDYQTSSDISELLKRELLVMRRQNMEADGITIFEATRDNQGEQRDPSGTAPRYTFSVTVSASADWKVFVPCVTRMASFEIQESFYLPDFQGKISMVPRMQALGAHVFIPSYA
jgi:hypothetical protein